MDRINLTQLERIALRTLQKGKVDDAFLEDYSGAIASLEQKGLAKAMYEEGGKVVDARLTSIGRVYIDDRHINWSAIAAIAAIVSAIAACIGLFVACTHFW